ELRKMCKTWLDKHPEVVAAKPTDSDKQTAEAAQPPETEPQPEEPREEPRPQAAPTTTGGATKSQKHKRKAGIATLAIMVADGAIGAVRRDGHDLLLAGGELYVYGDGIWQAADAAWEQRLHVLMQEGAETLGKGGETKLLTAAWKRLTEHPGLYYK